MIYEYEHRDKEKPLFLFNVTIQNHGGYDDEDYPTTVQVEQAPGEYPQTEPVSYTHLDVYKRQRGRACR